MKKTGKRLFALLLCVLAMFPLLITACARGSTSNAVEEASNGVVRIYTETTLSNGDSYIGIGSGFAVGTVGEDAEYFITNRHVITVENSDGSLTTSQRVYIMVGDNAMTVTYRAVEINGSLYDAGGLANTFGLDAGSLLDPIYDVNTNRMVECGVLYADEDYDFAILKTSEPINGVTALELAETAEIASLADQVYALGYPAVSDEVTTATGWVASGNSYGATVDGVSVELPIWTYSYSYGNTVNITSGTISRFTTLASDNAVKIVQHDATISSGNSGGPLVNSNGAVLAICILPVP